MSHSLSIFQSDRQSSVIALEVGGVQQSIQYTPYGHANFPGSSRAVGYAGQLREKDFGWYMLGNGHRIYNPKLMRFYSPDHLSPFDRGGINPYAYVGNDPMNFTDPSGLGPSGAGPAVATMVAGVTLGYSFLAMPHAALKLLKSIDVGSPKARTVLGYTLKMTGEVIAGAMAATELALLHRAMDPSYADVDDSGSVLGRVIAGVTGKMMSAVGEGLLLGDTVIERYNSRRQNLDVEAVTQQDANQRLLNEDPNRPQTISSNLLTEAESLEVVVEMSVRNSNGTMKRSHSVRSDNR